MKYLNIPTINRALHRITEGNTNEHVTGTVTSGLLQSYFPISKFITTSEQIQIISKKKPDFTVEKLEGDNLIPHVYVEIKSLINSNFNNIMDQLEATILNAVYTQGGSFSVFVIAMKGAKIAFFEYHTFAGLLVDYGINNYKGFIPLGYKFPVREFLEVNSDANPGLWDFLMHATKVPVPNNIEQLKAIGVESTSNIEHPHIWDLKNPVHSDYIHSFFEHVAKNKAGKDIV